MNKTRKLTNGAMLLAIAGTAILLYARLLSFSTLVAILATLAVALVIIIYGAMYSFKDSAILAFCLIILTLILGNPQTYLFVPSSILAGLAYSYGMSKDFKSQVLTLASVLSFVLGEILVTFVLMPILGLGTISEQINEFGVLFKEMSNTYTQLGVDISSFMTIFTRPSFLLSLLIVSAVLTGILEGYLLSLVAKILLKRLKLKVIGSSNILDIRISPTTTYILFALSAAGIFATTKMFSGDESMVYVVLFCLGLLPMLVLVYYGYIFVVIYGKITIGKKAGIITIIITILLFPSSAYVLFFIGFLYGTGPLRRKLEKKLGELNEKEE